MISLSKLTILAIASWLSVTSALPTETTKPNGPTRVDNLFTVKSYFSPYPSGQGMSGLSLYAKDGNMYLTNSTPPNTPVLSVEGDGSASLSSKTPTSLYINSQTGSLSYAHTHSLPATAITNFFVHLGSNPNGTVGVPHPEWGQCFGNQVCYGPPPAKFQTNHEPGYTYWFACLVAGGDYGVFGSVPVLQYGGCESGILMAALDFAGPGDGRGDWRK